MNPANPSASSLPHLVGSVGELRAKLRRKCHGHEAMADKILCDYDSARMVDLDLLKHFNENYESWRTIHLQGGRSKPAKQTSCNIVCLYLARLLSPLIEASLAERPLRERLLIIQESLGFALERDWPSLISRCLAAPEVEVGKIMWEERMEFVLMQAHFHLRDALMDGVQAEEEPELLELEFQYEEPTDEFRHLLCEVRKKAGLKQGEFGASYGAKQVAISSWELGHSVPLPLNREMIERMAIEHRCPRLLAAYDLLRDQVNSLCPAAQRGDIRYKQFVPENAGPGLALIEEHDRTRVHVMRSGQKMSSGPIAKNTKRNYHSILAHSFAAAQLPLDAPPRTQGLGLPANQVTLIDLLRPDIRSKELELRMIRGDRESIAYVDKLYLSRMASLTEREKGFFWTYAKELTQLYPEAIERSCPLTWPMGADGPNTPAVTPEARVKALSYDAHRWYTSRVSAAARAPFRRHHLQKLATLVAKYPRPLTGVLNLLNRVPLDGANITPDKFNAAMICCYLAIACFHPPRINDGLLFGPTTITENADRKLMADFPVPDKNKRSLRARERHWEILPPEIAALVRPYLKMRARVLQGKKSSGLFLTPEGQPVTETQLHYQLDRVVRHYAPDIFPTGLSPHYLRHIVTTDLCVRYGMLRGLDLAAHALRDSEMQVRKSYVLIANLPKIACVPGERSQEIAIRDAWQEALKLPRPRAIRLPRQRRYRPAA